LQKFYGKLLKFENSLRFFNDLKFVNDSGKTFNFLQLVTLISYREVKSPILLGKDLSCEQFYRFNFSKHAILDIF
jgi:hypothetical protein